MPVSLKLGSVVPAFLCQILCEGHFQVFAALSDSSEPGPGAGQGWKGTVVYFCPMLTWPLLELSGVMALVPLILPMVCLHCSRLFISSKGGNSVFLIKVDKILGNLHYPAVCPTNL